MRNYINWTLFVVWLGVFVWSFITIQMVEPTGSGFTRGLNRLGDFFLYQAVALGIGLLGWLVARGAQPAAFSTRIARYAPLLISGLFWVVVIGFYVFLVVDSWK